MSNEIGDFADFYSRQAAAFAACGGSKDFLAHVLWKTLTISPDQRAADRVYRDHFRLALSRLRAIGRRAQSLKEDVDALDEFFSPPPFSNKMVGDLEQLATQARILYRKLMPKKAHGRPSSPRRHFFISAVLPYIKWKPVAFRKKKRNPRERRDDISIKLWEWLSGWAEWVDIIDVDDLTTFKRMQRQQIRPIDADLRLLTVRNHKSRPGTAALNIRSWWQQSSTTAFHLVLAGSGTFLEWPEARAGTNERMRYAESVCAILKGRGISERELAGYPIGSVGAILRTAPRNKRLAKLMKGKLPRLSAHAHRKPGSAE